MPVRNTTLRLLFAEQIEGAIDKLAGRIETTQVHEARKHLKHARAILRLLRSGLTSSNYRRADHTVRDAARLLGATRDDDVLIQLIDAFALQPDATHVELALSGLRHHLLKRHEMTQSTCRKRCAQTVALLRDAIEQSQAWTIVSECDPADDGLRRTYRKGRKAYRAAIQDVDDNKLHTWRKQAKYCRYQLESLGALTQRPISRQVQRLARLGHILGDDHDLALLQAAARKVRASTSDEYSRAIEKVINHRRHKLQVEAFSLGASLCKSRPKRFAKRFAGGSIPPEALHLNEGERA